MKIIKTPIEGVLVAQAQPLSDNRGSFSRWFCTNELSGILGDRKIVQINHSKTNQTGSIRGLHFQRSPHSEMKFIRCIRGRVWDVALDLRENSPTFLQWHAVELSADNNRMVIIPEHCAHGFQVLEAESELLYLHTAFYEPASEGGINYADPKIKVNWPLTPKDLSDRDNNHPFITDDFRGIKG